MKPLPLSALAQARATLEAADYWTIHRDHDVARDLLASTLMTLAEAAGIGERGQEVIRMLIVEAEERDKSYDAAHGTPAITVERRSA